MLLHSFKVRSPMCPDVLVLALSSSFPVRGWWELLPGHGEFIVDFRAAQGISILCCCWRSQCFWDGRLKARGSLFLPLTLSCFFEFKLCYVANQGREQQRDHLNKQSPIFGLDEDSKDVLPCFSGQVTNPCFPAFCAPRSSHHVLVCSKPQQVWPWQLLSLRRAPVGRGWLCVCVWVFACRQGGKEPGRSSCSERGSFSFWQKVWILRQSLSPPPKAPACSPSHAGIWLLPSFLGCWEAPPGFGKGEEALAWGLAPSWAGREDAQVPGCFGSLSPAAAHPATVLLSSHGNVNTSLGV